MCMWSTPGQIQVHTWSPELNQSISQSLTNAHHDWVIKCDVMQWSVNDKVNVWASPSAGQTLTYLIKFPELVSELLKSFGYSVPLHDSHTCNKQRRPSDVRQCHASEKTTLDKLRAWGWTPIKQWLTVSNTTSVIFTVYHRRPLNSTSDIDKRLLLSYLSQVFKSDLWL